MNKQSDALRSDFLDCVELLTTGQTLGMPLSRNLSRIHKGLHELRLKDRSGQVRVFYFIKRGDALYVLHAFKKKRQGLPKKEIDIVLGRIREI